MIHVGQWGKMDVQIKSLGLFDPDLEKQVGVISLLPIDESTEQLNLITLIFRSQ